MRFVLHRAADRTLPRNLPREDKRTVCAGYCGAGFQPASEEIMTDCKFQVLLGPFHDRELDPEPSREVAAHVEHCPTCAAELAAIRDFSARIIAAVPDDLQLAESARWHAAVDQAASDDRDSRPLFRTMGLMAALAASVLIVSGVWLLDLKSGGSIGPAAGGRASVAIAPEWERVATTLRADPRLGLVEEDSPFMPRYASTVDWMLDGLVLTER